MNDDKRKVLASGFAGVINGCSAENESDTPDFMLAEYLVDCLVAFNTAANLRRKWYGETETSRIGGKE
jgi:hypothetical protein